MKTTFSGPRTAETVATVNAKKMRGKPQRKGDNNMKIKKIMAMLLAATMIMGTSVTTFAAAPEGTISVSLPKDAQDASLTYVQIITEDRESPQGWTFATDDIRKTFVNAWMNRNEETKVTEAEEDAVIQELFGIAENEINSNVKDGNIHSSVELSRALAAVNATGNIENRTLDPADMGLYMITAQKKGYTFNPMTVYVGPDFDGVTVAAKGSEDQIQKKAEDKDKVVSSGDILNYEIEAQYPYFPANATNTTFKISDNIEHAKIDENTVEVYINGEKKTVGFTATVTDNGYTMTVNFTYDRTLAGDEVVVKYQATVDDIKGDADIKVKNNAKGETGEKYTVAEVVSDSAMFTITKVDDTEQKNLLAGAEFTLYVADENGDTTIKYDDKAVKVSKVETKATLEEDNASTTFVEEKGKVTFFGLDPQKEYYVEETKAPEGYKKLETIWKLEGAGFTTETTTTEHVDEFNKPYTKVTTITTAKDYTDREVSNTKLSSLPSTGGIGTTIFTIGGCAIMVAAAGLFFASRRKANK